MTSLVGHYWTLLPHVAKKLRPPVLPTSRLFSTTVTDPVVGPVRLTGRLSEEPDTDGLLVVIHGLGGSSRSHYTFGAVAAAHAANLSCLRLSLRGADRLGDDFYHAGQAEDVAQALSAPSLARYERIYLFGYSLGGHVALRYAIDHSDPRVRAVASVCAPIDLDASCTEIDKQRFLYYRAYVLNGLKEMYEAVARRRRVPLSVDAARKIDSIREWDSRIVAPRFGFADAADYYAKVSVAPHLGAIRTPSLIVQARHDPMILEHTLRPALGLAKAPVEVVWFDRAGHVGFPPDTHLGLPGPRGLEPQVVSWLEQRG